MQQKLNLTIQKWEIQLKLGNYIIKNFNFIYK